MALTDQIAALATRIATEIKAVRTEIAGRVATSRTISTTAPLTGGGDLSANRTLAVTTGTTSGTVATGDHTHAYAPTSRTVSTTAPLTGGGDLSANRTLGVSTGTTSGTVATGDHTHSYAAVSHTHAAADVASGVLASARIPLVASTPYTVTYAATVTIDASLGNNVKITATGAMTLAVPTNPADGQMLMVAVLASGASRTVTVASGIQLTTGLTASYAITSGKVGFFGLRYSQLSGNWSLLAQTTEL